MGWKERLLKPTEPRTHLRLWGHFCHMRAQRFAFPLFRSSRRSRADGFEAELNPQCVHKISHCTKTIVVKLELDSHCTKKWRTCIECALLVLLVGGAIVKPRLGYCCVNLLYVFFSTHGRHALAILGQWFVSRAPVSRQIPQYSSHKCWAQEYHSASIKAQCS